MAQHRLIEDKTYNERLFSPGIRGFFHNGRFKWLYNSFKKLNIAQGSVIEIGCNDGRSLDYLSYTPEKYAGYDADWEGGLDEGKEKYMDKPGYTFTVSTDPSTFNAGNELFDFSLAMETLEHLPERYLQTYLQKLATATTQYGFYSFPNERGLLFFLKYYFKKIFITQREPHTTKEVWYALIGRMDKVERTDTSHKGFDYKKMLRQLEEHFDIVETQGIPFSFLPLSLNFTIGVVVKKKEV